MNELKNYGLTNTGSSIINIVIKLIYIIFYYLEIILNRKGEMSEK